MSVLYKKDINKAINDDFSIRLRETQDYFIQKENTNILGRDFEDILTTPSLYEEYVDKLVEGFDADQVDNLILMSKSFQETALQESISGVQPYAPLTMPMLVKLWARLSLKYAVPTEPVTMPAFTVAFMKPFLLDDAGVKHYLPESINPSDNQFAELNRIQPNITLTNGKVEDYNLLTGITGVNDPIVSGVGKYNIDKKFIITKVLYGTESGLVEDDTVDTVDSFGRHVKKVNDSPVVAKCNIRVDLYRRIYGEIEYYTHAAPTGTGTEADPFVEGDKTLVKDVVFGYLNMEDCKLTLTTLSGSATAVEVLGWVSSENHQNATNVGFEIDRKDIEIGTKQHIEASLPIEFLQDTKAMYQVDGAAEVVDIMSNVCAQKLDLEIYNFLQKSYEGTINNDLVFEKKFDVYPSASYAINPSEWLNELRKVIDILATEMRNTYKTYNGYYVIVGNPIDTMIIPNVSWTFNNVQDTENGIDVQYSIGAMSGVNKYTIISSDLIDKGDLTIFFVPTTDKFKTYTYYPYTFNVVQNYLNTRTPNVPSMMLTKRHTIEEFCPIIGKIHILHNDGSVYSRS